MDKENVVRIHNGVLFSHKEWNTGIFRKMYGTRGQISQAQKRHISHVFSHIGKIEILGLME
jgi:hypothetical protein